MDLPRGIDLIIGMDFMNYHDVALLCGREKVLFGDELLNFIGIDLTDIRSLIRTDHQVPIDL